MEIIKGPEKGETHTEIGVALDILRITIVSTLKDKLRIQEHVTGQAPMQSTVITKLHVALIAQLEKPLMVWLEDQNQLLDVVEMSRELTAPEDVNEWLPKHSKELTNENLIELEQQQVAGEEEDVATVEEILPHKV
ncbi:hypothetical protein scyTo_0000441 [Scyliorhinus torazame]|uniref:Uncharacterized protein n=1 Tax=Scyliorhinus torazame TaxID=75743 RepID=A0A401NXQ6_SCYTO|nr:hypothetical protein [Scyliorhinus torazame]